MRYSAYSGYLERLNGAIAGGVQRAPKSGQRIDIGGNLGAFAKRFRGQMCVSFGDIERGMAKQFWT